MGVISVSWSLVLKSQMFGCLKYQLKPDYFLKPSFENGLHVKMYLPSPSIDLLSKFISALERFSILQEKSLSFINALSEVLKQFQFIHCTKKNIIA